MAPKQKSPSESSNKPSKKLCHGRKPRLIQGSSSANPNGMEKEEVAPFQFPEESEKLQPRELAPDNLGHITNVYYSKQHNARGILAMANSGPNTNESQFFVTYAKQPHLNGLYTVFGRVIHWFEVLDIMEKTRPGDRPLAEIPLAGLTTYISSVIAFKSCSLT